MTYHARVDENGQLVLPDHLARDFGLKPGDVVSIEHSGDALLVTRDEAPFGPVMRLRSSMKGYSVDQFLMERRADWGE